VFGRRLPTSRLPQWRVHRDAVPVGPGQMEETVNVRRLAIAISLASATVLAASNVAVAANPNLAKNAGFEKPKVVAAGNVQTFNTVGAAIGTCSSPGNAIGCWRLGTGEADLTRAPVWTPKSGKQSLELNTGPKQASIGQSMPSVSPGVTYKLTFYLSADPAATDNLGVDVSMYNVDAHGDTLPGGNTQSFSYFDPTHTAANMKFQKHTMTFTSASSELRVAIAENGFLGDPEIGPVVDAVSVKL
jgi:hypothetical protein